MRRTFIFLLLIILPLIAQGKERADLSSWATLSSEELLSRGRRYEKLVGDNDTSIICYTLVTNRYYKGMSAEEQRTVLEAYMGLQGIYFFCYYDFTKCFQCLRHAKEIAERNDFRDRKASVYLALGSMYNTLGEENHEHDLMLKALNYYRQAFTAAETARDQRRMDMAFTNVLLVADAEDRFAMVDSLWNSYQHSFASAKASLYRKYNVLLYRAIKAFRQRQPEQSLAYFDQLIALKMPAEEMRLPYTSYIYKVKVLQRMGRYAEALAQLQPAEALADQYDMKDCKMEVYYIAMQLNQQLGDNAQYARRKLQYYEMHDSLTNYKQLVSAREMEMQSTVDDLMVEVDKQSTRRQKAWVAFFVVLIIVIVVAIAYVQSVRMNRLLQNSNRMLYLKNEELLAKERKREERLKQAAAEPKYKNSRLDEDRKEDIYQKILQVMNDMDEISKTDYTVENLASKVGVSYRYVSQVIHEKEDMGFNQLLNRYRVKEACRRFTDDEHYGQYTLEAISNSIGFKSYSAFNTVFKQITGLTPSVYRKMAKGGD